MIVDFPTLIKPPAIFQNNKYSNTPTFMMQGAIEF